jgi:hypothetical protein
LREASCPYFPVGVGVKKKMATETASFARNDRKKRFFERRMIKGKKVLA